MRLLTLATFLVASVVHAQDHKALLAHIDGDVRIAAADQLAIAGAKDAVPELTECLVDDWWTVRVAALRALRRAGAAASPALPAMRRCLDDTSADVRAEAFIALVRLGHIEEVAGAIGHDNAILDVLGTEHDDILRLLLAAESWQVRLWVLELKHVRWGAASEWTDSLGRLAASDSAQAVRSMATEALGNSNSPDAWSHVVARLDDSDSGIRLTALGIVAERGKLDSGVRARVIELLGDSDPLVREWSAYMLRSHVPARAKVAALLDDKSERVRLVALTILAQGGNWPEKGGNFLVDEALKGDAFDPAFPYEWATRVQTTRSVGGSRRGAPTEAMARKALLASGSKAVPDLIRVYHKAQVGRRLEVVDALGHLKGADALLVALKDKNPEVRLRAAACRVFLGEFDAATLELLVEQVSQTLYGLRFDNVDSIGIEWSQTAALLVERAGKPALPVLEKRLAKFTVVTEELDDAGKTAGKKVTYVGDGELIHALIEAIKQG